MKKLESIKIKKVLKTLSKSQLCNLKGGFIIQDHLPT